MGLTDYTSHPTDDTVAKVIFLGSHEGEMPKYFADIADADRYAALVNAEWERERPDLMETIAKVVEYHG